MGSSWTDLRWNLKNILYALFIVGVWYGSSSSFEENNSWFPTPRKDWKTALWVIFMFVFVYALSIFLDHTITPPGTTGYAEIEGKN